MKIRARWLGGIFRQSAVEWWNDNAFRLSAALAYYTVFSLAPILVLATAVAGMVLGDQAAHGELTVQLQRLLGADAARAVNAIVKDAHYSSTNIPATIVSGVVLIVAATGVFSELKSALNQVWGVVPQTSSGIVAFLKDRLASFAMVLCIGFLLLVSLLVNAAIALMTKSFAAWIPIPPWILEVGYAIGSLLATALLFALIFKVLPDTKVHWRDVAIGAFVTAALFTVGRWLIGLYLGRSTIASAFGASASLAVVLVWSYYSAMIILYGAEFTEVFARSAGSRALPAKTATDAVPPRKRAA